MTLLRSELKHRDSRLDEFLTLRTSPQLTASRIGESLPRFLWRFRAMPVSEGVTGRAIY